MVVLVSMLSKAVIAISVPFIFDRAIHLHCCQHIADNIQQRYGNKVRPLFWRARREKTKELFHKTKGGAYMISRREPELEPIQPTLDMAMIFLILLNH